jgi:hypothetical protein
MPQKQAHHLRTGQAIIIAARQTPTFRTGKRLEDRKGAPEAKTAFIDTALTAAAEVVRIRASFEYTPGCKTRQNRPSISLFRYSAKSTLGENFKLWGDFCVPREEFKQHVFATEQGMIRCNHCSMLCLPGAFETSQWSVYDRKHWQPSGRRERNCRRSHKAIHTF